MTGDDIRYATSLASERQIFEHLARCDSRYQPPLSGRVDVREYARKLHARARTLEAWHRDELVGLVAMYVDDSTAGAFVSSVSVDEAFAGRGIGTRLVGDAVALARSLGMRGISLEVSRRSTGAMRLYEKHGFRAVAGSDDAETVRMHLSNSDQAG